MYLKRRDGPIHGNRDNSYRGESGRMAASSGQRQQLVRVRTSARSGVGEKPNR